MERSSAPASRRLAAPLTGFVLAGGFYMLLIDTTSLPELYTGAGVALLASAGYLAAREVGRPEPRIRAAWLLRLPSVLARIPADAARLAIEAGAQLVSPRARRGTLRAIPFDHGGEGNREAVGRRALAELAGSLAPNTIVLGVDADTDLLLVHQLRRSGGRGQIDVLELG